MLKKYTLILIIKNIIKIIKILEIKIIIISKLNIS